MYQIKLDYPNMPKGQMLSIPGLGTYANGSTNFVTKEQADAFRTYQRDNGMPDRTLLEAFKGAEYVTVESSKDKEGKPPSNVDVNPGATTVSETQDDDSDSSAKESRQKSNTEEDGDN